MQIIDLQNFISIFAFDNIYGSVFTGINEALGWSRLTNEKYILVRTSANL
jgi:hypothetical protein